MNEDPVKIGSGNLVPPPLDDDHMPKPDNIVTALLKSPETVVEGIANGQNPLRNGLTLLVAAVVFHATFGLAMGLFGGWSVAFMDAVKVPLTALFALALCYPALYVFACVGGAPLTFSRAFVLGAACLAMLGLILVGLAPVAWLFSVSTESVSFVTMLVVCIWGVAVSFAVGFIAKLQDHALFRKAAGVKTWFFILALVTLQMATCLRPMLAKPKDGWWTGGKLFFLSHFGSTFDEPKR
ncbi:MAG: hypothetical protein WCS52_17050 [bacterium]